VKKITKRELKDQAFKVELKMVGILSVDNIQEIQEMIPELVKKGIDYNYAYILEKEDIVAVGSRNSQKFIALQIEKYDKISEEDKNYVNNVVVPSRKKDRFSFDFADIEKEQEIIDKYAEINRKREKDLEESFIDRRICKKVPFRRRVDELKKLKKLKEEIEEK
jgi:hypothetical protein